MRKFLCIVALSVVYVLAFQSGAVAQYEDPGADDDQYDEDTVQTSALDGPCAGAAEQLAAGRPNVSEEVFQSYYSYLPDVGGCVSFEGNTFISSLSVPVYDAETGEELGIVKDLDSDLTSGEFSVTHEEFCGGFIPQIQTAQNYFDQDANAQEQAILDPDGDGFACSESEVGGEVQSSDVPCSDFLSYSRGYWGYFSDAGGCVLLEGAWPVVGVLNASVQDPDTRQEIGLIKDLDPDLTSGDFSVTYEEFCEAFPTPEYAGPSVISGLTAQEYFDREANDKERAILDPNGDGLACSSDDGAFLAGAGEYEPEFQLEDTWTGVVTQTNPDGEILEYEIEVAMIPLFYITDSMIGDVVAEVSYPTIGCSGVWVLDGFNGGEIMVEERITTGRENCLDTPVTLTPRDDGSLDYYFLGSTGNVGECVLSLQNAPDDDPLLPSEILRQMGINELPDTGGASSPPVGALLSATGISETVTARRRI